MATEHASRAQGDRLKNVDRRAFLTGIPFVVASIGASARAAPNPPRPGGAMPSGPLVVGQPPPPLALERVSGTEPVTLTGLAGRVVVLDFWATWCRPCRQIMPLLDGMYRQYRAQGLSVVGLSPEPERDIRGHIDAHPVRYTIARDIGGTIRSYGVRGIPMLVALDRAGEVREVMVGVNGPTILRLDSLVQRLLAERI